MKKAVQLIAVSLVMLLIIVGCSNPSPGNTDATNGTGNNNSTGGADNSSAKTVDLKFMAAAQSGSWYPLAVGITENMKKNIANMGMVSILPGGGVSNVIGVNSGQAQLGFAQGSSVVDGIMGTAPFQEKTENTRYMLSLFPHQLQIVVLKDSGIKSIEDIKGKRINVGPRGLLTEQVARTVLQIYGIKDEDMGSIQNLSFADSVEQMKDGRLDVLFWHVPVPYAVLTDLAQSKDMDILSIPEDKIKALTEINKGFLPTTIKTGVYRGLEHDVETIKTNVVVIANKDVPEDFVYQTTKSIYEGLDELKEIEPALKDIKPEDLPVDISVPWHPGAEKFFKEKGLIQ